MDKDLARLQAIVTQLYEKFQQNERVWAVMDSVHPSAIWDGEFKSGLSHAEAEKWITHAKYEFPEIDFQIVVSQRELNKVLEASVARTQEVALENSI